MARRNRVTGYDLQRHLITGERGPLSGEGIVRDVDDDTIDMDDPMQFGASDGRFDSQSAEAIIQANAAQAGGLDSAAAVGDEIPMASANDNSDPGKGGLAYGPRNTGGK